MTRYLVAAFYVAVALGALYIVAHVLRLVLHVDLLTAAAYVAGLTIGAVWLVAPFLANMKDRKP